ncbi:MAG TPA: AAA family ATPase [Polyangiaceae bacterium]|nr:AAA family ATPase [Polyangiaceae bacterium]
MLQGSIGAYECGQELGAGAMGTVFHARQVGLDRPVALKRPIDKSAKCIEAINREVSALRRIQHPGVVRFVDSGTVDGLPWYAMELLEGESLRRFKNRIWSSHYRLETPIGSGEVVSVTAPGSIRPSTDLTQLEVREPMSQRWREPVPIAPLELRSILRIGRRLCSTLAFLHGEGFVNCDLKPENVILVHGNPVIVDFGLAARQPGESSREAHEVARRMVGTLPYMSPEQIRGELVDARSDLYSMGCLLYELLTGRVPFLGSVHEIVEGQKSRAPEPLRTFTVGLPPRLEAVIAKLLAKEPAGRFGYADEVASALSELVDDDAELATFPAARSYLYRPRFVGRQDSLSRLAELAESAAAGGGTLALLGGESGVGKTRIAMELTRHIPSDLRVVAGETSALSADGPTQVGPSPLHGIRPLLRAVANHCVEGGAEVTERLLGHRRAVLALYEPLLAQVPAYGSLPPAPPLAADSFRQRLFRYLAEVLEAFAEERPFIWIFDDAGWADDLSLAFLASLTPERVERTPMLILCCYRSEEECAGILQLTRLAHVAKFTLKSFERSELDSMVRDILAIAEPPGSFAEFVAEQAGGNPFFLAEYLRAAVSERILVRDQRRWQLLSPDSSASPSYAQLRLPRTLRELIERRLGNLSQGAQKTAVAIAVFGKEAEIGQLEAVSGLSSVGLSDALEELVARQVIDRVETQKVRFGHDKLREVAYSAASESLLAELHGTAADVLEVQLGVSRDAERLWAILGHHFSLAGRAERAATYMAKAAAHARATHAISDAIRLYREAIEQYRRARTLNDGASSSTELTLLEGLGDVLGLSGLRVDARAAYEAALERTSAEVGASALVSARLFRKLGKTWETQHPYDEALRLYGRARDTLGDSPPGDESSVRDEWVQIRADQVFANYWLGRLPEITLLVAELNAALGPAASPWQRTRLHRAQLQLCFRRDRYALDDEGVEYARAALNDCLASGDLGDLPLAHFNFAFALFLRGEFEAADWELKSALAIAERMGDIVYQARSFTYLSINARRRGQIEDVLHYLPRARATADAASMGDYIGIVRATESWLAWREGSLAEAKALAERALETWAKLPFCYAFQWTALWQLLDISVAEHQLADSARFAAALVDSQQQRLPDDVTRELSTGLLLAQDGDAEAAENSFRYSISGARRDRFL